MPTYDSIIVKVCFESLQKLIQNSKNIFDPPPLYEIHPEDPFEFDTVTFGRCIAGVNRMMFGFHRNMKRKIMDDETFFLLFTVTPEINGES